MELVSVYYEEFSTPSYMERAPDGYGLRPAREIFGMDVSVHGDPAGHLHEARRLFAEYRPGGAARSSFDSGDWANLYNGSELDEYREALAEAEKRSRDMARKLQMNALLDRITI